MVFDYVLECVESLLFRLTIFVVLCKVLKPRGIHELVLLSYVLSRSDDSELG